MLFEMYRVRRGLRGRGAQSVLLMLVEDIGSVEALQLWDALGIQ